MRDRPLEKQAQADQAHAKFDDEKSEFTGTLKLWKWLDDSKGGHGKDHKLSHRQFENLLRENFINVRRLREWRDIHTQLHTVVAEHKWVLNTKPASYEQLHLSMLAGPAGQHRPEDRGGRLVPGRARHQVLPPPGRQPEQEAGALDRGAELVETTRLFGRGIAAIEPLWLEQVGAHLIKKQLLDPHWEKKAAQVTALERATLYGLVVYHNRRTDYGRVDPAGAREIFIREALVAGEWETRLPFLAANQKLVKQVAELEHKSRRQDVLVDDELIFAFYDAQLPADVFSGASFERWYKDAQRLNPKLLLLAKKS